MILITWCLISIQGTSASQVAETSDNWMNPTSQPPSQANSSLTIVSEEEEYDEHDLKNGSIPRKRKKRTYKSNFCLP